MTLTISVSFPAFYQSASCFNFAYLRAFIWVVGTVKTRSLHAYWASARARHPLLSSSTMHVPTCPSALTSSSMSTAARSACASASDGFLQGVVRAYCS